MRGIRLVVIFVLAVVFGGLGWAIAQGEGGAADQLTRNGDGSAATAAPLSNGFTYQGYLTQGNTPYTGVCDLQFKLWDAGTGGAQIGATQTLTQVTVTGGRITTLINGAGEFGLSAFNGQARWLEVAARCSIAGGYIVLTPRQPLRGVPYALGLRPGAVISGTLPATGALVLDNAAEDGFSLLVQRGGILIDSAGDGFHVNSTIDEGFQVNSAGDNGLFVGAAGSHGVAIETADVDGIRIASAGDEGVDVVVAENNGFAITNAGLHGVYVDVAGIDGLHVDSAGDDGVTVDTATDDGVTVGFAGDAGFNVNEANGNGFSVETAGASGLFVWNAYDAGIEVISASVGLGVYGNAAFGILIQPYNADWAGSFTGDVYISGSCTGCLLATMGVNVGDQPLRRGDIVAIQGIAANEVGQPESLWQVVPFRPGLTAVGVVAGGLELKTYDRNSDRAAYHYLAAREGTVAPGDYVSIITYGPFQVQIDPGTAIAPGDYVIPAASGQTRRMDAATATVADMLSAIGVALSAPDADGKVWVLVNGR